MADEIYVINKDGYIGKSTKSEIEYTREHNKPVKFLRMDQSECVKLSV